MALNPDQLTCKSVVLQIIEEVQHEKDIVGLIVPRTLPRKLKIISKHSGILLGLLF